MKHKFSDNCDESALPVEGKGSSVRPIPKREPWKMSPEMDEKIKLQLSEFGPVAVPSTMCHTEPESYPVAAKEGFLKPPTHKEKLQSTPIILCENPEEETATARTTATTEAEVEAGGDDNCTKDSVMDIRGNPVKPKGQPLVPGEGRNRNRHRKRAAWKYWKCN